MKKFLYVLPVMALMFVASNVFAADSDHFVIKVDTRITDAESTGSFSFEIPTVAGETYNYDVDCTNNGQYIISGATGNVTCDYNAVGFPSGIYYIRIIPKGPGNTGFPRIKFDTDNDADKLLTIEQWGTTEWTSMENAFSYCGSLTTINATDAPDLSGVTDLSGMFGNTYNFTGGNMDWDVSHVTNMSAMFAYAYVFNGDFLSSWNTSSVTDMNTMFSNANLFNSNIGWWNVSNVEDMNQMFAFDEAFNQDISFKPGLGNGGGDAWNVGNVKDMGHMFNSAETFNQNIGNWDTSEVTDMNAMFYANNASSFNQDIGNWNTAKVTNMSEMFYGAASFNQDIGKWNVEKVNTFNWFLKDVTLSTQNYDALLTGWNSQNLKSSLGFDGGNSKYCAVEAHDNLISATGHNWIITDGGKSTHCATPTPIYRLYNTKTGAQLYTRGEEDKNKILSKYKDFEFTDGAPAFWASTTDNGTTPIFRLYNKKNGAQLYTRGESDKNKILSKYKDFEFTDGAPAFYASLTPQLGLTPIFRLYNTRTGMQLYTRGQADKDKILSKYSDYEFTDGVPAFYANTTN